MVLQPGENCTYPGRSEFQFTVVLGVARFGTEERYSEFFRRVADVSEDHPDNDDGRWNGIDLLAIAQTDWSWIIARLDGDLLSRPLTPTFETERSLVDRPDEVSGWQLHPVYLIGSDGVDEGLDISGWIADRVNEGLRRTPAAVVTEIDSLLEEHNEADVATILNARGHRSGTGEPFHARRVAAICRSHQLDNRFQRLRSRGWLTGHEMAAQLRISTSTVRIWRRAGLLRALPYIGNAKFLYEPPGDQPPAKHQGRKLSIRQRFPHFAPYRPSEVQSDA